MYSMEFWADVAIKISFMVLALSNLMSLHTVLKLKFGKLRANDLARLINDFRTLRSGTEVRIEKIVTDSQGNYYAMVVTVILYIDNRPLYANICIPTDNLKLLVRGKNG